MALAAEWLLLVSAIGTAIAGAGVFLLIRTLKLTRDSTAAAQKSVDVAVSIELPILQVADVRIGEEGSPAQLLRDPLLRVWVENYGKTPAFIDHVVINAAICRTLPEKPNYQPHFWLTGPRPLSPREKTKFREATYRNEGVFPCTYDEVEAGKTFLWVYGFLDYFDFLGKFHRRGFCARWDRWDSRFHPERNPNYDYFEDRTGPEEKPDSAQAIADALKK